MAEWFTNFASKAINQAVEYADGLADSLVAQANDVQEQLNNEQSRLKAENDLQRAVMKRPAQLPWETSDEALEILSHDLMEKILQLSLTEANFTTAPPNAEEVSFEFNEFVPVIMQLLTLDSNLARLHAKVSPKMNEEDFWRNYFCRVGWLRAMSGIDGADSKANAERWEGHPLMICAARLCTSRIEVIENLTGVGIDTRDTTSAQIVADPVNGNNSKSAPESRCRVSQDESSGDDGFLHLDDEELNGDDLDDLDLLDELDLGDGECDGDSDEEADDELEAQIAKELAEGK